MGIRPKLILVFIVLGFAPLVLLSVILYRRGVRSVEADLREGVTRDATGIAREIDATLRENETALEALARSSALHDYVRAERDSTTPVTKARIDGNVTPANDGLTEGSKFSEVKESISAFMLNKPTRYIFIYGISPSGKPLFRAEIVEDRDKNDSSVQYSVVFRTENVLVNTIDARVWKSSDQKPLLSPLSKEANGATLRYSIPIFTGDVGAAVPRGVLIAELNGNVLFNNATMGREDKGQNSAGASDSSTSHRDIVLLSNERLILYHTNETLRYQKIDAVMPWFKDVADAMIEGRGGWSVYNTSDSRWLVAYVPVNTLGMSVSVAGNYTAATGGLSRLGWIAVFLFSFFGLASVVVFSHVLRNTARSIERVTEGAVAIAGGRLEQRIEVRSNDETRLLAESFNKMTDRLREQIARETESRQFASFMRLSAMLTHDLKNSIAGLSLLVGNMERQFHREEFRADAMKSLTEATDKLRRLVSKLSEPVLSLSSEHKLARPTDLIVAIRRAITTTVEPARGFHEIDILLPETLMATVEADRVEKVFENLMINAIEAMGIKSGTLTIEAGVIEPDEVYFRVSDTGPGMSEEFQRVKLFRPFATTKKSGICLGLYTCREIVHAHGGRIDVESKRGSGATFRVVLPSVPKITRSA